MYYLTNTICSLGKIIYIHRGEDISNVSFFISIIFLCMQYIKSNELMSIDEYIRDITMLI
jgi:hypothetical protein